jgi:hypothetical protein
MGFIRYMTYIDKSVRTKEEIFRSDYVTLFELALFDGSREEMYRQMKEFIVAEDNKEDNKIKNRWEILDI